MMSGGKPQKKSGKTARNGEVINSVFRDRARTNLLKKQEQVTIFWLVQRMPDWLTSNMLTALGFFGYIIVFGSFLLATFVSRTYLLLGIIGFAINWFGDSLDGRLAYYRKKPRKQYGFALDITIDWLSIILIGMGYIVYIDGAWELFGYGFVVMYGWEMIVALIRYKLTGKYSIDAGKMSPTEVRIFVGAIMIGEVVLPGSLVYTAAALVIAIFIVNIMDTRRLLRIADEIDKKDLQDKS